MSLPENLYNRLLDIRNLSTLTDSESFQYAISAASTDELNRVTILCEQIGSLSRATREASIEGLKSWIKEKNQGDLNTRDLREKARKLGVRYYSRLPKSMLLSEIHIRENQCKK